MKDKIFEGLVGMFLIGVLFLIGVVCLFVKAYAQTTPPAEGKAHVVTISWKLPAGKYTTQNLYRIDSCGNVVYLKSFGKNVTQAQDTRVVGGQVLQYKLRSVMNGVESADSNISKVTVPY